MFFVSVSFSDPYSIMSCLSTDSFWCCFSLRTGGIIIGGLGLIWSIIASIFLYRNDCVGHAIACGMFDISLLLVFERANFDFLLFYSINEWFSVLLGLLFVLWLDGIQYVSKSNSRLFLALFRSYLMPVDNSNRSFALIFL